MCGACATSRETTITTSSRSRATSGASTLCWTSPQARRPRRGPAAPAARLLRALCPTADVVVAYPTHELDGMLCMHGHHIDAHVHSAEGWPMNRLAWRLTGAARPPRLTPDDHEALIGPLYELMYEMANLRCGRRAQQRFERRLDAARRLLRVHGASTADVVEAVQAVCRDLAIRPGTLVFGHTHEPLDGVATADGRHRLFNSGAWVLDRRGPQRRVGTVLRATGGELELRGLLDDCDERDLARMLDDRPRRAAAA